MNVDRVHYEHLAALSERKRTLQDLSRLESDLTAFFRAAWVVIEPETPLIWSFHYDWLCEWLTLISSGEFKKLNPDKLGVIVNVPPRSGKS